ncbi:carotenoid ester lipase precursor [Trametes versicolor FP-101664 SS1]|uniref:carotenoid ester lipase precursor n=1 Tax=Trametes versicolor (strain FP-101664) TaxID=717944 RepID=UPI000462499B|nr:carotenoid ester lipase precursor [Trametes versicolor FP-101664 SS1]EIW52423.1 carotenoid ester lipase precursor [Trametes versicolor FP-101664 SS1]
MFVRSLSLLPLLARLALAAPLEERAPPTIQLDQGTFVGTTDGTTTKFLGIPFGKAPVGDLRFNLPVAVDPYTGTHTATAFGPSCPQQAINFDLPSQLAEDAVNFIVNSIFQLVFPSDEDCLSINVMVPAGTQPGAKLPVAAWIFGGGFELGSPSMYDGSSIVSRSVKMGEPVIYVSMNYRVSAYGFLASQEVKDAGVGNLGLQDQRLALKWIQKYISAFGGDPTKVTIWGESAGAISVGLHMVANGGNAEGLFRGAFMQSGSPIPVGDISHGQPDYDALVSKTGCTGAADTLNCLRQVPFATLKTAVDASPGIFSPQSLRLAWLPRVDGTFLVDAPQNLVQDGSVAGVPFVSGDCDDEGTLFSLSTTNVTTETDLRNYIHSNYLPQASSSDLDQLLKLYPQDITQGSPFNTGILNALTPQFKRLAAMQGDLVFQAPRRLLLQSRSGKQPMWSFLNKRLKGLPALGSAHATDILNIYGGGDMADYLINFVNNLDPNGKTVLSWPQYSTSAPKLLTFQDGLIPLAITQDNFRVDAMNFMTELSLKFPL